jgi:hypothetical protein
MNSKEAGDGILHWAIILNFKDDKFRVHLKGGILWIQEEQGNFNEKIRKTDLKADDREKVPSYSGAG